MCPYATASLAFGIKLFKWAVLFHLFLIDQLVESNTVKNVCEINNSAVNIIKDKEAVFYLQ